MSTTNYAQALLSSLSNGRGKLARLFRDNAGFSLAFNAFMGAVDRLPPEYAGTAIVAPLQYRRRKRSEIPDFDPASVLPQTYLKKLFAAPRVVSKNPRTLASDLKSTDYLLPFNKEGIKLWSSNPTLYDLPGIDTREAGRSLIGLYASVRRAIEAEDDSEKRAQELKYLAALLGKKRLKKYEHLSTSDLAREVATLLQTKDGRDYLLRYTSTETPASITTTQTKLPASEWVPFFADSKSGKAAFNEYLAASTNKNMITNANDFSKKDFAPAGKRRKNLSAEEVKEAEEKSKYLKF